MLLCWPLAFLLALASVLGELGLMDSPCPGSVDSLGVQGDGPGVLPQEPGPGVWGLLVGWEALLEASAQPRPLLHPLYPARVGQGEGPAGSRFLLG